MDHRVMTVSKLFRLWLEEKQDSIAESTHKLYEFYYKQYIGKAFGRRRVRNLTTEEWTEFENSLEDERTIYREYLSPSTVRQAIGMYHRLFEFGSIRYGLPSPIHIENKNTSISAEVFSREDVEKMESIVQPFDIYHLCIMLGLHAGIKFTEMCGLKWKDVDPENKQIEIRRLGLAGNTSNGYAGECEIVPLKNEWDKRELPVPDWIMQQLAIMKQSHDDEQLLLDEPFEGIKPIKFRDHYDKFLKKAGVEHRAATVLRHTYAVSCIENGILPEELRRRLGHRDVYVTYKQYGELIRKGGRRNDE